MDHPNHTCLAPPHSCTVTSTINIYAVCLIPQNAIQAKTPAEMAVAARQAVQKVSKVSRTAKGIGTGRTYTSKYRGVHQTFPTKRWEAQFRHCPLSFPALHPGSELKEPLDPEFDLKDYDNLITY